MALVIGVYKGHRIYLGDVLLKVLSIKGYQTARVEVSGKSFDLSDRESVEVYPSVLVSVGAPSPEKMKQHESFLNYADREQQQREDSLAKGQLTQEEFDNLPEVVLPYDLMPRLVFEAPRSIRILRGELYENSARQS